MTFCTKFNPGFSKKQFLCHCKVYAIKFRSANLIFDGSILIIFLLVFSIFNDNYYSINWSVLRKLEILQLFLTFKLCFVLNRRKFPKTARAGTLTSVATTSTARSTRQSTRTRPLGQFGNEFGKK